MASLVMTDNLLRAASLPLVVLSYYQSTNVLMVSEVVFVAQAQERIVQPHPQKACVAIKSPLWALLEWLAV